MSEVRFGSYRVVEALGSGAISTIYRAVQEPLGRIVALKALKTQISPTSSFGEQLDRYPEAVLVREKGTIGIYRPDEWPPDSAQIVGRKFLDGRIGWYAGPDAGARSDPAAFARMRDLAGPDGTVTMGGVRFQFAKPDGGAP